MLNTINITTSEAQESAYMCSGENAPNLSLVNNSNWLVIRREFLSNVLYNGASSHRHIINVLEWLSQFNTEQ
jgi:hypothetical protein